LWWAGLQGGPVPMVGGGGVITVAAAAAEQLSEVMLLCTAQLVGYVWTANRVMTAAQQAE
jgi:hypothetical protein